MLLSVNSQCPQRRRHRAELLYPGLRALSPLPSVSEPPTENQVQSNPESFFCILTVSKIAIPILAQVDYWSRMRYRWWQASQIWCSWYCISESQIHPCCIRDVRDISHQHQIYMNRNSENPCTHKKSRNTVDGSISAMPIPTPKGEISAKVEK